MEKTDEASFCSDNDEEVSEPAKARNITKQMESPPENLGNQLQENLRNQLEENPGNQMQENPRYQLQDNQRSPLLGNRRYQWQDNPRSPLQETPRYQLQETPRYQSQETPRYQLQETPRNKLQENEVQTQLVEERKIPNAPSSVDAHSKITAPTVYSAGRDLIVNSVSPFLSLWITLSITVAVIGISIVVQNSHLSTLNDLSRAVTNLQGKIDDLEYANTKIREDNNLLSSQINAQERLNNQLRNDLVVVKRKVEELEMAQRKLQKLQEFLSTHQSGRAQSLDSAPDDTEGSNSIWKWNYFSSSSSGEDIPSSADGDMFDRFLYSMKQLRNTEFRSQTDDTWTQLEASAMKTMSEVEPSRPSAVLILSPPSLDPIFGHCFAKKIAVAVNDAFQMGTRHPKVLDSQYLREIGSVSNIHNDLNAYLKSKGKAVVVSNLAEIQEDPVLMVLHAYCENSNALAPDSRANFFSAVTVPQSVYDTWRDKWSDYWQGKRIATDTLDLVWQTVLTGDKRAALISRVASAVVLLQEGDTCV